jgi:adsorption protein B
MAGAGTDPRVRLVIHAAAGPTTKADCLNRLYAALCDDEAREGRRFRSVVLQDAEDMVHPAALQAIDEALFRVDFVQLPVRPEPQAGSRWIARHYGDEFAEAHAKAMVVRSALGAALPAAGVGCGFAREALAGLAQRRWFAGETGPFAADCLTEDYELGLILSRGGRGSEFLRLRDAQGRLVATRSYFPASLVAAVRQKTRWVHGIAFQSWDRLGWTLRPLELWMALRDRRGPLAALVLASAYLLLVLDALLLAGRALGWEAEVAVSLPLRIMLALAVLGFFWRTAMRFAFTAREYGWREGVLAVLRIPVSNIIAIMAGRRALGAYLRTLRGGRIAWDKTAHLGHPAQMRPGEALR